MFDIESYISSLPNNITSINVQFRELTYLPDLNRFYRLKSLFIDFNRITNLPLLPDSLRILYCNDNQIEELPVLPKRLRYLRAGYNKITKLPQSLPPKIKIISLQGNQLTDLPYLPSSLKVLYTVGNKTSLEFLHEWRLYQKRKYEYFSKKFGIRIEKFYIKNVRNKRVNDELLYSPELPFYKRHLSQNTLNFFSIEKIDY